MDKYWSLYYIDSKSASSLIKTIYKKYPYNYDVIYNYMYDVAGGKADNNNEVLVTNKEILLKLADKLFSSEIEKYRLDAWNIKAKVLFATGNEKAALEIYDTKFVDWYQTKDQKKEQLYTKETKEFIEQLDNNINELLSFAGNKVGKHVIYSKNSLDEKMNSTRDIYNMYLAIKDNKDFIIFKPLFKSIFKEIAHRGKMINMSEDDVAELVRYDEVLK